MSQFYKYFRENMEALNLPAPEGIYGTVQGAIATAKLFVSVLDSLGPKATVGELVAATTRMEKILVVSSLSGSYYVGAVIGSIAVATGRSLAGGTSLSDVLAFALRHGAHRPWLVSTLQQRPVIYDAKLKSRKLHAELARRK
ncbi:hypothetical protein [Massilia endophytica]|uniref:hypothetical protein n=1 Tax=Massilia endophytica TaxID=2899220 RepID=UPI001E383714|nr:hypothetical protein [Massilia endophytica]UGQ48495.1 hypothetical protein LSQ66_08535 [Massilia endophytica]